jgi:hypothetical protein
MSDLDKLREEYASLDALYRGHNAERWNPLDAGFANGIDVSTAKADALITALEAEVERANELCIRDLEHTEKRAEQAEAEATEAWQKCREHEAEVAIRDRMLRDIIERIALTPERWNGWTTEEVLADLRARAEKEAADA